MLLRSSTAGPDDRKPAGSAILQQHPETMAAHCLRCSIAVRDRAARKLTGLITRRPWVQILLPLHCGTCVFVTPERRRGQDATS